MGIFHLPLIYVLPKLFLLTPGQKASNPRYTPPPTATVVCGSVLRPLCGRPETQHSEGHNLHGLIQSSSDEDVEVQEAIDEIGTVFRLEVLSLRVSLLHTSGNSLLDYNID